MRYFPDRKMYYLHNRFGQKQELKAIVKGKSALLYDPVTDTEKPVCYCENGENIEISLEIEAAGSSILFVYDDNREKSAEKTESFATNITEKLKGQWEIASDEDNILTLDYCDVYFDGRCAGKNIPISDVQEMEERRARKADQPAFFAGEHIGEQHAEQYGEEVALMHFDA